MGRLHVNYVVVINTIVCHYLAKGLCESYIYFPDILDNVGVLFYVSDNNIQDYHDAGK